MATIKTIEYSCPHCGKKVPYAPQNDYCAIKGKFYGDPNQTCRKCKKVYKNTNVIEPAAALTLKDPVPFWITGFWTITLSIFAAVMSFGFGLFFIVPGYLAACILTKKYRQEHKDRLLTESRNRLKDPEYFVRYLLSSVYIPDKSKLTPQALAVIHMRAISAMDADMPLDLSSHVRNVLGM